MLLILLIASMFTQGLTIVSYGKSFITAFPENVGYFYPNISYRDIRVTAIDSSVSFTYFYNSTEDTISLQRGQTCSISFPKAAEVHQLNYSSNTIRITSNGNIVVHSYSQANISTGTEKSIQSHAVQPITNLGTHHLIPSLSHSDLIQAFGGTPSSYPSQRYSSFKLMIINAEDVENTVTIVKYVSEREEEVTLKIPSYQLIQIQANDSLLMVKSSHKVSLMLTHPCLEMTTSCKCSMIVNQILPTEFQGRNFVVPYIPYINQRHLLMRSEDKSTLVFNNNEELQPGPSGILTLSDQTKAQYVNASGNMSLTLISQGVFIELIPENMFAACYLLQLYSDTDSSFILVIAETDRTNNLYKQRNLVTDAQWTEITGTKYSSAIIDCSHRYTYIWHSTSKIAVYILEKSGTTIFGTPAIPINEKPDEFGCALIPGEYEVSNEYLTWTESLAHCTNLQKHLACPSREDRHIDFANTINTTEDEDAWIGLRRSLKTTEWYWQRQTPSLNTFSRSLPVYYSRWADGQPLHSFHGLCASLSLDSDDDFKWKSVKCCEKKRPVCYKPPLYLLLI